MRWNWEQVGWPQFLYDYRALETMEQQFLLAPGNLWGPSNTWGKTTARPFGSISSAKKPSRPQKSKAKSSTATACSPRCAISLA